MAVAGLTLSGHAAAQMPPPVGQPPPPAAVVNPACMRLESQLASLDQGGPGAAAAAAQRLRDSVAKQRSELERTVAYARSLGCERRLFLFGPTPPPQCNEVNGRISAMRTNLDRLQSQAMRSQGGGELDMQRRQLIGALAQNNCGPQYRAAAMQPPPVQRREGGLFGMLFGGGSSTQTTMVQPQIMAPEDMPRASTWRTVCVRSCDGFFFPVSYSTVQSAFPRDEAICRMTCPGTEARLFAYPNPGGAMEQAVSPAGEYYASMPNAFKYRSEFVPNCSCRPDGMSWAEALQGVDDRTLRKGDIIVDEAKAEAMSRPKDAPPPKPVAEAPKKPPAPARAPEPAPEFDPFASDSSAPTAAD